MSQKFIPLSVPNLKGNELEYVTQAIKDEWVSTGGAFINTFEEKVAEYVGVEKTAAVQNGTAGLHLSLIESGVKRGDEVIAPTLTFIAAVNPIKYIGAEPVFMDCDDSLCIDPDKIEKFLEEECTFEDGKVVNKKTSRQIKAIVVVHVFGNLADMERIMEIASKYNLKVVEDSTEALGSKFTEGKFSGKYAGTIGDFGVYSFNGNKIMTTGGGGMVLAKDNQSLDHMKFLSTQAKTDTVNFIHGEIGFNYRMTNLQAAMGVAQLEQLETFIETKKNNFHRYHKLFNETEKVELIPFKKNIRSNYWFYALLIKEDRDIQKIIEQLHEQGIQTRPIWGLIHQQNPYVGAQTYEIEKAIYYGDHVLNIPCSSNLKPKEVDYVAEKIKEIV